MITIDDIRHAKARRSFRQFVEQTWPNYIPNRFHDVLCNELEQFYNDLVAGKQPKLLLTVPPRHGKLLSDDTPVLTTKGWKNHGDLAVGDYVFGRDGQPVRVTHVHPKDSATLKVIFSNGDEIKCNEDHLWLVFHRAEKPYGGEKIVSTNYLLSQKLISGQKPRCRFQIPVTGCVDFQPAPVALDPYVLGVWLGDGRTSNPDICYSDADKVVFDAVVGIIGEPSWFTRHKITGVNYAGFKQIKQGLCEYGLIGDKHIPKAYLHNDRATRLQLLAGLIDTDGHVDKRGRVRIVTSCEKLKDDIYELCTTLGFRPYVMQVEPEIANSYKNKLNIKSRKTCYTIGFNPDLPIPTVIPRKNTNKFKNVKRRVGIVDVVKIEPEQGNCITVEGGLYLAGKTMLLTHNSWVASQRFPLWFLGKQPSAEIIIASYSATLATEHSGRARALVAYDKNTETYGAGANIFPNLRLDETKKALDYWKTTEGGSVAATGLLGSITGRGAALVVIDDPLKGFEEAASETIRNKIYETYSSDILTRMAPQSGILLIQTRWHEDDLAGRLMALEGDEWKHVNFPAIAETDEYIDGVLFRREGEALVPERYPVERLQGFKKHPRTWAALFQQRPAPAEGDIIKREWFQYYTVPPPSGCPIVQSWDLTFGDTKGSDYVAGLIFAEYDGKLWLIDGINKRMGFSETLECIRSFNAKYPTTFKTIIENKANGPAIINMLGADIHTMYKYDPGKSNKLERLHTASAHIINGKVMLPNHNELAAKLVDQCCTYPQAAHDDVMDAFTQAAVVQFKSNNLADLYASL